VLYKRGANIQTEMGNPLRRFALKRLQRIIRIFSYDTMIMILIPLAM